MQALTSTPRSSAEPRQSARRLAAATELDALLPGDEPASVPVGQREAAGVDGAALPDNSPRGKYFRSSTAFLDKCASRRPDQPANQVELLESVLALASDFDEYRAHGEAAVGLVGANPLVPAVLNELIASSTLNLAQVDGASLRSLHRALVTLGAGPAQEAVVVAIRERKMQLQDQHAVSMSAAMQALSIGESEDGLTKLKEAQALADRLIAVNGFTKSDDPAADILRKDLMNEALTTWHSGQGEATASHGDKGLLRAIETLTRSIRDQKGLEADRTRSDLTLMANAVNQSASKIKSGRFKGLGRQYTAWGTNHSLGTVVNTALRYLTLSTPARALGNWIQGGRDSGVRYAAGAVIKGLANITGAAAGVAGGVVSLGESIVSNVGEATLRLAGAGALGLAGSAVKLVGVASVKADARGTEILNSAKSLATNISFLSKGRQELLSPVKAARVSELAALARITGSTTKSVREAALPGNFKRLQRAEIPNEILARNESNGADATGKAAKLRFDPAGGHLIGDRTNNLMIGVYSETVAGRTKYFLSFVGTQASRPATVKSNLAQGLGIEDTAYNEADIVVRAFVAKYGKDNVELLGHSLGGGLATWAGIKNGVKVTGFNSAGLHVHMRNRLGAELIDQANVDHYNTVNDVVSQRLETRMFGLTAGSQVGNRHVIAGSTGHSLRGAIKKLESVD